MSRPGHAASRMSRKQPRCVADQSFFPAEFMIVYEGFTTRARFTFYALLCRHDGIKEFWASMGDLGESWDHFVI